MIKVITPPTAEPVSLDLVKQQIRIIHDDEDVLIESYIKASRQYCEDVQGRAYIEQTIRYTLDRWPSRRWITLPRAPLMSVTHVKYTDIDGNVETLDVADYTVDIKTEPGRVVLKNGKSWPSVSLSPQNAIEVEFKAGYGSTVANVPATSKQAIMMLVAHYYENRETIASRGHIPQQVPMATTHLLNMDQVYWTEDFNR